jgi:hypothetical protein
MTKRNLLMITALTLLFIGCSSSKQTTTAPPPKVTRDQAKFDFSPPSRAKVSFAGITIALVKPTYVGKNPEYFVAPFNEMALRMGDDFEELLTAKGFTMRGPYGSRDEMTFTDKINSSFILEISVDLNPEYNRKYTRIEHSPSYGELLLNKYATTTYTYKMSGLAIIGGNLVIKAKSAQYGELLWTKSIALEPAKFDLPSQTTWTSIVGMSDELNQDDLVYNTLARELEKIYLKALNLAWQQIDPEEMKTVAEQGKKADKRGN